MINWARSNWFVLGILAMVGLAWLVPGGGAPGGWLYPAVTTKAAVVLIFFLQGLALPTEEVLLGLRAWRLHVFVQAMLFLVAPALVFLLLTVGAEGLPMGVRLGFLFLAILPTTITTAVVFTARAGGAVTGALFNVVVANVLGVFIVPLWAAYWTQTGAAADFGQLGTTLLRVGCLLLLPLVIGQVLRPFCRKWVERRRRWFSSFNSALVLFIIYCAFAGSVAGGAWEGRGAEVAGQTFVLVLILTTVMLTLAWWGPHLFGFNRSTRWAAFFCASQKGLAAGVPMAKAIFDAQAYDIGLILLPLLFYHPLLLLVGGLLLGSVVRRGK